MKIVSDKPLRVATLGGTAVLFEAGVPRDISDEIGLIAIQMGAKELNTEYAKTPEAEVTDFEDEIVITTAPAPEFELVTALEKMMDEGDPINFKTDGYPKASAVNKAVGRTVSTDEREAAWESVLNS